MRKHNTTIIITPGIFNKYTITTGLPITQKFTFEDKTRIEINKYMRDIACVLYHNYRNDVAINGVNPTHVGLEVMVSHKGKKIHPRHYVFRVEDLDTLDATVTSEVVWTPIYVMDVGGKGKRAALRKDNRNFDVKPRLTERKGECGGVCKTIACNCTEDVIFQRSRSLGPIVKAYYCQICATNIASDITCKNDFPLLNASKITHLETMLKLAGIVTKRPTSNATAKEPEFNAYPS